MRGNMEIAITRFCLKSRQEILFTLIRIEQQSGLLIGNGFICERQANNNNILIKIKVLILTESPEADNAVTT